MRKWNSATLGLTTDISTVSRNLRRQHKPQFSFSLITLEEAFIKADGTEIFHPSLRSSVPPLAVLGLSFFALVSDIPTQLNSASVVKEPPVFDIRLFPYCFRAILEDVHTLHSELDAPLNDAELDGVVDLSRCLDGLRIGRWHGGCPTRRHICCWMQICGSSRGRAFQSE